MNCTVAMSVFTTTYGYAPGSTIQAIAWASNIKGWGLYSNVNTFGTLAQVVPASAPTNLIAISNTSSITLTWNPLTTYDQFGYVSSLTGYAVIETTTSTPT